MKGAVLLLGHGSRDRNTLPSFKKLVREVQKRHPSLSLSYAFLELLRPSLLKEIEKLAKSHSPIRILPVFLFAARHWKRDIPALLAQVQKKHPRVPLILEKVLGAHPLLAGLIYERVKPLGVSRKAPLLLVGRGSGDPDVKREFFKLARLYQKKHASHRVLPCFYDLSQPTLEEILKKEVREKTKGVVVMPYLLFPGRVLQGIRQKAQKHFPKKKLKMAPVLGVHPKILAVLDERLRGTIP